MVLDLRESVHSLTNVKTFYHTIMYNGKSNEDFVSTRIRMFDAQKEKSSMSLLADKNSATQHLKRCCYQAFIWYQCTQQIIDYPNINEDWGWKTENQDIVPIW